VGGPQTPQARRLGWLTGGYLGALYLSLYPFQFVLDFLRQRGLLRAAVAGVFVAAATGAAAFGIRARWTAAQWAVAAAAALLLALLAARLEVAQERLHLVEYGLLALLVRALLVARWGAGAEQRELRARAALGAVVLTAAAGWVDEGIQALLPNRYYDLRDVGFNAGAGLLAVVCAEAHAAAGARGKRAAPERG
jgi:hypothetical protein